jgi:hypothetical protein
MPADFESLIGGPLAYGDHMSVTQSHTKSANTTLDKGSLKCPSYFGLLLFGCSHFSSLFCLFVFLSKKSYVLNSSCKNNYNQIKITNMPKQSWYDAICDLKK